MSYQVQTEFFNFNKRGDAKKITVGTTLTNKQFRELTPAKRAKCTFIVVSPNGRVRYTRDEISQLVELYLENDNVQWVRDTFVHNNPDQLHTVDSVNALVGQLRALDTHYPDDTQWDVKNLVAEIATEIAPSRLCQ